MDYLPAESNTGMFGGNSNWRGPVWMPVNVLIIRALLNFYLYYGDNFKIECPTGSGKANEPLRGEQRDLLTGSPGSSCATSMADGLSMAARKSSRVIHSGATTFYFYEYFHGDNGAGLGASHQTGWTGLVAKLIELYGFLDAKRILEVGRAAAFTEKARAGG